MSVSFAQLAEHIASLGLDYAQVEGYPILVTKVATEEYRDGEGGPLLSLVISIEDDGAMVDIWAPLAHVCSPDHEHLQTALGICMDLNGRQKLVFYGYCQGGDAIAAKLTIPLQDAELTRQLLNSCLDALRRVLDGNWLRISTALASGTDLGEGRDAASEGTD